ncbi:hypothetical protein ACFY0A_37745 [Streptomyces sp. NPDC001698]|uniref:hypothetical protein n=1 Tax=Streptomyces sp. NPDC001698 TaxID=3364601 RepID=UPI0036CCF3CE
MVRRTEEWHGSRIAAYGEELEQIRREEPPHNTMGTSRYVCPDTPGIRRRNELNALRARAKRDAELLRGETWRAATRAGADHIEASQEAEAVYIDVLDRSGVWAAYVERLRTRGF